MSAAQLWAEKEAETEGVAIQDAIQDVVDQLDSLRWVLPDGEYGGTKEMRI